jgi:RNA polymerase-binding transcription factor DksA
MEEPMSAFMQTARRKLQRRRDDLLRLWTRHAEGAADLGTSPTGPRESAAGGDALQVIERLRQTERRELAEIDAALARIERGDYGRCPSCEGPIAQARLRVLPEARVCLACASAAR